MSFTSKVFETRVVKMADREETIVAGGRHLFPLLPKAFEGIRHLHEHLVADRSCGRNRKQHLLANAGLAGADLHLDRDAYRQLRTEETPG